MYWISNKVILHKLEIKCVNVAFFTYIVVLNSLKLTVKKFFYLFISK